MTIRLVLATFVFFMSCVASAVEDLPKILVLQAADRGHFWTREQLDGIEQALSKQKTPIDLHVEDLGLYRFNDERYRKNLARFILDKYLRPGTNLKGIITTNDEAFEFLMDELAPLGQGLPVVSTGYFGFTDEAVTRAQSQYQWLGIRFDQNFDQTVLAALKIHPKTRRVFILHDSSGTAVSQYQNLQRQMAGKFPPSIEVHEIGLGTFEETARILDSMKDGDIVIRLRYYIDGLGRAMGFEQSMGFLRQHTKVPMYSCWEGLLGNGIVGGLLGNGKILGQAAGDRLLEMMNGTPTIPEYPVQVMATSTFMFDQKQLDRFHLDRRLLPAGSIIINQPLTYYRMHPIITGAVAGTILALSGIVLFLLRIVSKLRATRRDLLRAKAAAEKANVTKTQFLANVSHEIRTPLTAIIGYADFLEAGDAGESQKIEFIEKIRKNGNLVSNLVNDILDLSSAEFGRISVEKTSVSLEKFFKELAEEAEAFAVNHGLAFEIVSAGSIPKNIMTDSARLRQIMMNLIGNAIKYTPRGSITIRSSFERGQAGEAGPMNRLKIDVIDTGVGIAAKACGGLFVPFGQVDDSMTRKYGGTGLGLALSRDLARALGGDVALSQTEEGRGSTFTVTIDAGETSGEWVITRGFAQARGKGNSVRPQETLPRLDHVKILLVEDSPENQAIIKRYLSKAGAEVDVANDGAQALEKANQDDVDLILMDIQMPVLDGIEATARLRAMGFRKPILALTAHALKEQRERSLMAGFDEHLTKPVCKELLITSIAKFVREPIEALSQQS